MEFLNWVTDNPGTTLILGCFFLGLLLLVAIAVNRAIIVNRANYLGGEKLLRLTAQDEENLFVFAMIFLFFGLFFLGIKAMAFDSERKEEKFRQELRSKN